MLKVGDKVKIRRDLKNEWYSKTYCNYDMLKYSGMTATIKEDIFNNKSKYKIDLDNCAWEWNVNMFEPIEFISKDEFERFIRS